MTKIVEMKVFGFKDLDTKVRDNVINNFCYNAPYFFDIDDIDIEMIKEDGKSIGFNISDVFYDMNQNDKHLNFNATISTTDALKMIEDGKFKETIVKELNGCEYVITITAGREPYFKSMTVSTEFIDFEKADIIEDFHISILEKAKYFALEKGKYLMKIYTEKQSEDYVADFIIDNEYKFFANGDIVQNIYMN